MVITIISSERLFFSKGVGYWLVFCEMAFETKYGRR